MARQLAAALVGIGPRTQVVAVVEGRDRALERKDLEPVSRQVEIADDLGAEQAHHVGKDRELEAGEDFLGDRGAADDRALLENQHFAARAREVRGGDQPVVAAADDDGVVAGGAHAFFRSGSKNGSFRTTAAAWRRSCSTVISMWTLVPGSKCGARMCASARYSLSSGDQQPLDA
jgi:hypothetical protein